MYVSYNVEEYWTSEAKVLEELYIKEVEIMEVNESEDTEAFTDLIELWVAIGLYANAGYELVDSIPDMQLQGTLQDLRMYAVKLSQQTGKNLKNDEEETEHINELKYFKLKKKYSLTMARAILLSEISRYLGKNNQIINKENIVLNGLLESEAFLPITDILSIFSENDAKFEDRLPIKMIKFWQDIIVLLQDINILESLIFKLLTLVGNEQELRYKRHMAALWINAIAQGFLKLTIAQQTCWTLKHKVQRAKNIVSQKALSLEIEKEINKNHPNLQDILTLNISNTIPYFMTDIHFVSDIILNANIFTCKFITPFLQLIIPKLDVNQKDHLMALVKIYTHNKFNNTLQDSDISEKIFTIDDICNINSEHNELKGKESSKKMNTLRLTDNNMRNSQWKLTNLQYRWGECPIGILPWQINSLQYLKSIVVIPINSNVPISDSNIIPGMVDKLNMRMQSLINWDNVFRKKKRLKRKQHKGKGDILMYKAIEFIKEQR